MKKHGLTACAALSLLVLTNGCFFFVNVDLTPAKTPIQEKTLEPADSYWTSDKVALVDMHGLIFKRYGSSGFFSSPLAPDPVSDLRETLARVAADSDVKVVVLRIDSPGGMVSWSDAMYRELKTFRESSGKPVYACVTGIGASGAYYAALAADEIYAAPSSTVGSIGVIAIFLNLEKLAGKIGVETEVIKSGARKDMGGLWRGMDSEEKKIMQDMIDEFYERFVGLILENRPMLTREALLPLADGRLYTAPQAAKHKLIDGVAYLDETIEKAKKAVGIEDAAIVTYGRAHQYKSNIYSEGPDINIVNLDVGSLTGALPAGLYYLWQPEM